MENRQKYHYACLDFAYDDEISIWYFETYQKTFNWQGDVDENNVIIMATIFNSETHKIMHILR